MKVNMKHVVEIAGGLIIGSLASDAVNGLGKMAKKSVIKIKTKVKEPKKAQGSSPFYFFTKFTDPIMERDVTETTVINVRPATLK